MSSSVRVKGDFRKLDEIVKGLTGDKFLVKIGILGRKAGRRPVVHVQDKEGNTKPRIKKGKASLTNAELGLVHELGSPSRGIPARSFLRMPLFLKQDDIIAEAAPLAKEKMATGNLRGVLVVLGVTCENVIQDAFGSAGFGNWAPDSSATKARKGSAAPLIDSGQLRKAITSSVEKRT